MTNELNLTPSEMRQRIEEVAAGSGIGPGRENSLDFVGSTVRNCLRAARHAGWSGEDAYTQVAWNMMNAAQRYGMLYYELTVRQPPPSVLRILSDPAKPQPMETAPKSRVILLCMPELGKVWSPGWWRGGWSFAEEAWAIHLPLALEGKAGMASLVAGAPQPTGWMEMPPCP